MSEELGPVGEVIAVGQDEPGLSLDVEPALVKGADLNPVAVGAYPALRATRSLWAMRAWAAVPLCQATGRSPRIRTTGKSV